MSQPQVYKALSVLAGAKLNLYAQLLLTDSTLLASCRELNLQADPGNAGNNVIIGDDAVASSRAGIVLTAGSSRNYRSSGATAEIPLSNIFYVASAGNPQLNVEILP